MTRSGVKLREWMGVTDEQFYDPDLISLLPMDFYYPGKGAHGDNPPRKDFAPKWHPQLLELMPDVQLILLVGAYSQKHYLDGVHAPKAQKNLTETVRAWESYLPKFLPLVHPSPLNFRWQAKNPWFEQEVVPLCRSAWARFSRASNSPLICNANTVCCTNKRKLPPHTRGGSFLFVSTANCIGVVD